MHHIGPFHVDVTILATAFRNVVRATVGDDACEAIDAANATRRDNTCASHDYCDANDAMAHAFRASTGRDYTCDSTADDDALVTAAWRIAKLNGFAR